MILWKPYGSGILGPSAYIKHCEYKIREIREINQFECRQSWTGKNTEIPLKMTRAESLEAAKAQCNAWDEVYAR